MKAADAKIRIICMPSRILKAISVLILTGMYRDMDVATMMKSGIYLMLTIAGTIEKTSKKRGVILWRFKKTASIITEAMIYIQNPKIMGDELIII